jgi:4-amino-4-deoxy-L-arabinose transferase-like glycosyltransferase
MALVAATAGALYHHTARRLGRLAGLTTAALLVLMPRTFAHAHYAHYDMPMTCLCLLAQVAFLNSLRSPGWAVPFGVALGLGAGTKFTGCFAAVAPTAWVVWSEGRAALRRVWHANEGGTSTPLPGLKALAWGLPVAAITLVAIQPPWWFDPVRGVERYLRSNLSRGETIPIPTFSLDRVYRFSLPWHNTLVLTGVTTPVVVLVLALLGLARCWVRRRSDPGALVWPLSWAVLMIVRALPAAPGHDVVRLFLPSIASTAVLAGYGASWLSEVLRPRRLGWVAPVAAALAVGESLAGIAQTYPYTDSYYNAAVGGLRGVQRGGRRPPRGRPLRVRADLLRRDDRGARVPPL